MAGELLDVLMECERHITIRAMRYPAALAAFYHRCKAAAVLEKNHLFTGGQSLLYASQKQGRERSLHHLALLQVLDIHYLNFRQLNVLIA